MKPSILLTFAHGERGTERCVALSRAAAADDLYGPMSFGDIPVDVRMELVQDCPQCHGTPYPDEPYNGEIEEYYGTMQHVMCGVCCDEGKVHKFVNIELKEMADFWASKATGHLGTQVLQMIAEGQPGFIAVYGSLQEVMAAVPKVKSLGGRPHARSQHDIASDISTARAFSADAIGCGVPVHFLSSNHDVSSRWILSYAKNILLGPSLASWLPRWPVDAQSYGCLCAIYGIGDVAAKKLLRTYGGMGQIANECKHNPEGLAACVGGSKAKRLLEVLG